MPKAQSKGCQRKNRIPQRPGVNEQQIDSEDKEGDLQDSCSTLGLAKNAIDEKIAAFFEDRPFFYDIENAPWGDRAYTSCGARTVIVGIAWASCDFLGCNNITKSYGDPIYCNRTTIVRSATGARTMLPTMDLQDTGYDAYDAYNRKNITPR